MSRNLGAIENNRTASYYQSSDGFVSQVRFTPAVISHEGKQQPEAKPCRAIPPDAPSSETFQGGEDRQCTGQPVPIGTFS